MTEPVDWVAILEEVLPRDLPRREDLIRGAARHCDLVLAANRQVNLTRIVEPRAMASKHVLDSVLAFRHLEGAHSVLVLGFG
jgi:16S rRNA G527 N7-methylase RsmG